MGPFILSTRSVHGQVLEDPLLRLLQTEVILVQDSLRFDEVGVLFAVLAPGQREHPVDVVAHDGRLGAHRRHHLELADLLLAPLACLVGHLLGLELLLELLDLVLEVVAIAELLLDRAHLLVQVVLLLGALHLLLDPTPDALLHLEHLDLGLHEAEDLLEALGRIDQLQELLAILQLQIQVGRDGVGEARGRLELTDVAQDLRRHLLVELDVALEGGVDAPHQGLELRRLRLALLHQLDVTGEIGLGLGEGADRGAGLALDQHLHGLVGQAQQLDDRAERTDPEDVVFLGLVLGGHPLSGEQQLAAAGPPHPRGP